MIHEYLHEYGYNLAVTNVRFVRVLFCFTLYVGIDRISMFILQVILCYLLPLFSPAQAIGIPQKSIFLWPLCREGGGGLEKTAKFRYCEKIDL